LRLLTSVTHTPGGGALKLILAKEEQNEDRDDAAGKKPKPHDGKSPRRGILYYRQMVQVALP
jgi:hypothetical protein